MKWKIENSHFEEVYTLPDYANTFAENIAGCRKV